MSFLDSIEDFNSDVFGADEAKKAAREQEGGYREAEDIYRGAGARYNPYAQTSLNANRMIDAALGGDYSDFYASPDYQFRLQEGRDLREGSAAARGMLMSGATLKDLDRYGQNVASTEYGNWYNRMAGLRGEGIGIADRQVAVDDRIADARLGQAGARASGYMADANVQNYFGRLKAESWQDIGEYWSTMGSSMGMGGGGGGGMMGGMGG